MARFLLHRFLRGVLTIWLVMTLVFFGIRITGDPARMMVGDGADESTLEAFRDAYGLNESLAVQYGRYVTNLIRGDFGNSLSDPRPVTEIVGSRIPITLQLMAISLGLVLLIGVTLGVIVALRRDSVIDRTVITICMAGQSMPGFLIAILFIFVFSVGLHWLPSSGHGSPQHFVLPVLTMTWGGLATITRLTRSSVLEALQADYVRTARAKGVPDVQVIVHHVLRNAAIPLVTLMGFLVSGVIAGSVIVETVFAWPGMGRLIAGSVAGRDYPVLQFSVLLVTAIVVTVNFLVDVAYGVLDPAFVSPGPEFVEKHLMSTLTARAQSAGDAPAVSLAAATDPRSRTFLKTLRSAPVVIKLCVLIVLLTVVVAVFAPVIAPLDPAKQDLRARLAGPSSAHWFGADQLGRDVFSRTVYGTRISIGVAVIGTIFGMLAGTFLGMLSGYLRGRFDDVVMFLVDTQQALPFIVLALVAIAIFGPSISTLLFLISIAGWEVYARFARASTLAVRESQYVLASRSIGTSEHQILRRHVLPNIIAPLIVIGTMSITGMIMLESSLSFLGVGVQPPTPSWGGMIAEGRQYLNNAWWIVGGPAIAMVLLTLSISLVGDWLRDVLDPTSRRR